MSINTQCVEMNVLTALNTFAQVVVWHCVVGDSDTW